MVKICPICKKFVPETAQKCPMCGNAKLVLANVPASTAAKISPPVTNTKQAKKKKKSKAPIVLSLITILAVAAIAFFAKNNLPFSRTTSGGSTSSTPSHRTQNIPEPTPEPKAVWEIRNYTDEFGETLPQQFIYGCFYGTFSNTATTNSPLTVVVRAEKYKIEFLLFEYGDHRVQNAHSRDYDITMRTPDGEKQYMHSLYGRDSITLGNKLSYTQNVDKTIQALCGTGTVDFYIEDADRRSTKYLFSVETSNFSELYNLLPE